MFVTVKRGEEEGVEKGRIKNGNEGYLTEKQNRIIDYGVG